MVRYNNLNNTEGGYIMTKRQRFLRSKRKHLILFNSEVYTVKSVYRKKVAEGINAYLKFYEGNYQFAFSSSEKEINNYSFIKKGTIVTLHIGNGGYFCIEKGENRPINGCVYAMEK